MLTSPARHHPRVLLSEGSSLSARQMLYALGPLGYRLDVCDPRPYTCLARFSRYARHIHCCPVFARDPSAYAKRLLELLGRRRYDVFLPTHDQVFLLSRLRETFGAMVGLPVPSFSAIERLQSRSGFLRLLDELALPHPASVIVRTRKELEEAAVYPSYVKTDYSTAGRGVWQVSNSTDLQRLADQLERGHLLDGRHGILVQRAESGVLCVVQSVFQNGRLLAVHCYASRAQGVGGSARARVSVDHPQVRDHVAALGAALDWHGALTIDYLCDPATGRPSYIDANPRIGETFNATRSGVNLSEILVRVALGAKLTPSPLGRVGVRTHSVLMSMLAASEPGESRRRILSEVTSAIRGAGIYADSADELTRPRDDPPSIVPVTVVLLQVMLRPKAGEKLVRGTVENYALNEPAATVIRCLKTPKKVPSTLPWLP
jgi:predicted ATP-grasp superfamily ATP-dependent carboligase